MANDQDPKDSTNTTPADKGGETATPNTLDAVTAERDELKGLLTTAQAEIAAKQKELDLALAAKPAAKTKAADASPLELVHSDPEGEGDIASNASVSTDTHFVFGRKFRLSSESGYNGDTIKGWFDSTRAQLDLSLTKDNVGNLTLDEFPNFDQSKSVEIILVVR